MLHISSHMAEVLGRGHRHRFFENLERITWEAHRPEAESIGRDGVRAAIMREVAFGETLGLKSQRDLGIFFHFALILGWRYRDAAEHRWIEGMLRSDELGPPSERLELVVGLIMNGAG